MAPRITIHSSASANSTSRTWTTVDQRAEDARPNGRSAETDTADENEELSDMDEPSLEEVDELDESDSGEKDAQPQWETISSASAGAPPPASSGKTAVKKPRPKPPTTRTPGQTIVPMSRVEAILSTEAGQHGIASKEASFLISLATEEFIRHLTRAAYYRSRHDGRSLTSYNDTADTAYYFEEYKFLQEIIPRPVSLKTALAERKRILEEQEALLHGVGVNNADSVSANHYKMEESSSMASTPIPRLTKKTTPNTSANGKTSSRSKNAPTDASPPVVRSERQKSKKARLAAEAQAAAKAAANGAMAPPPSPAVRSRKSEDSAVVNGSTPTSQSGPKIKIRLASSHVRSIVHPDGSTTQPPILPLGPPSKPPSRTPSERQRSRSRSHSQQHNGENANTPLVIEQDSKSGVASSNGNGQSGNVQFAPVGVDASDQPLWTRVPLPPPPSAKVGKTPPEDAKSRSMVTDLDSAADQARMSKASKTRSTREHEDVPPSYPQDESKPTDNANGVEPPAKRPRQRQRSGESTSSKGSLREVLNGSFPNTGRTIYSQR